MLSRRIITAAILASFLLAGLFLLPATWFSLVLIVIAMLGAFEWTHLYNINSNPKMVGFLLLVVCLILVLFEFRVYGLLIEIVAVLIWIYITRLLFTHPRNRERKPVSIALAALVLAFAVFAISELLLIDESGPWWVLGMFVVIWVADAAAYFTGRRFGRRKLAPQLSPGKTVEGLKGSLFAIFAFALISGTVVWDDSYRQILLWVVVCLVVAAVSVLGDLYVSMAKRIAGVKDSGTLLPGHGGVLDRIDSTLSAAPVYALCVKVLLT